MSEPGLIIAGGGPAGVAAAESFREHDAAATVQILTADPNAPYERPPLSKQYLRGQTDDVFTLILACGAPTPLSVPGGHCALPLRSLADAAALRDAADTADTAVVVGSGFISCEAAASLALRGVSVTLVAPESVPQEVRLDREAGKRLRDLVTGSGVSHHKAVSPPKPLYGWRIR